MNFIHSNRRGASITTVVPTLSVSSALWEGVKSVLASLTVDTRPNIGGERQRDAWMAGSVDKAVDRPKKNPYRPGSEAFIAYEDGFDSPGVVPRA